MSVEPQNEAAAEVRPPHVGHAALNLGRDLLIAIIIGVALFLIVRPTIKHTLVQGSSMEPTFFEGERVLVNALAYRIGQPSRGDVIVFHWKYRPDDEPFIKRVIGLPGEEVEVRAGKVYVNGEPIEEPWTTRPASYTAPKVKLGPDEYYVLGDNRANSSDSHVWGAEPADLIMGKVWLTIWPPRTWPILGRLFSGAPSGART
ncbi:MAG: signal peptidase I [Anaerolineae bacterium]